MLVERPLSLKTPTDAGDKQYSFIEIQFRKENVPDIITEWPLFAKVQLIPAGESNI